MNKVEITCPRCFHKVGFHELGVVSLVDKCKNCEFFIDEMYGIPVLRDCENAKIDMLDSNPKLESYNSKSLNIPFIDKALSSGLPTLQLGGGGDICLKDNLIKTDAFLYSTEIDIIADAHALPFADESFSYVYTLAVFEHLHSPWVAADEIFRILKPGGEVYVLTAFMQHVHGYPEHYFNMTTEGLKRIFANFEIKYAKPSIQTSFDQLSYIFMDFVNFVNEVDVGEQNSLSKNQLIQSLNEFCNSVEKLDGVLLNESNVSENWQKIAPSIELLAVKNR